MKKSKKGFTLIEIIITLVITAIVGTFLAAYLVPQIQVFHMNSLQSTARSASAGILNELQDRFSCGTDFVLNQNKDTLTYTHVNKNSLHTGEKIELTSFGHQLFPNLKKDHLAAKIQLNLDYMETEETKQFSDSPAILIKITILQGEKTSTKQKEIYTQTQVVRCPNRELPLNSE